MIDACDIAIVGAGAAGLAAAIFAGEAARAGNTGQRIVLLDGAKNIGAKILVSGGGRCNVTHDELTADDFHGPGTVIRNVLRAFDEHAAARWFEAMGVPLKREDTGKLFPVSDDAHTVLSALLNRCAELGVTVLPDHRVSDVSLAGDGFHITHNQGALSARRVIFATGGRSLPRTGSDGTGYAILKRLGHSVTATYPALVPLVLREGFIHAELSGVSHEVELSTVAEGKRIDRRAGSLLWTHFGISGPVVMDASRFWVMANAEGRKPELSAHLLPGQTFEQVERWLIEEAARGGPRAAWRVLAVRMPQRVAQVLLKHVGISVDQPLGQLAREKRRGLVHALTALPLPVVRERGWNYAEVTAGGVPLAEIDFRTMQSRRVPGLYLVGEVLDCDGRIGGFNFQWAWATGHVGGRGVIERPG